MTTPVSFLSEDGLIIELRRLRGILADHDAEIVIACEELATDLPCPECKGTGQEEAECYDCTDVHEHDCHYCDGEGEVDDIRTASHEETIRMTETRLMECEAALLAKRLHRAVSA